MADKSQEIEVAAEVGGVLIKVAIGSVLALADPTAVLPVLASELVGVVIPNLRRNRVEKLIAQLCTRVSGLEEERVKIRFTDPEWIDLFEDGCVQASRALDEERLIQLATFLTDSVTEKQLEYAFDKRLLTLLGELNRVELIILESYSERQRNSDNDDFQRRHAEIFRFDRIAAGAPPEDHRRAGINELYRDHLITLGLIGSLGSSFSSLWLTPLGSALLKKIGAEDLSAIAHGHPIRPLDTLQSGWSSLDGMY